jgi:protein-disulfide isomerase
MRAVVLVLALVFVGLAACRRDGTIIGDFVQSLPGYDLSVLDGTGRHDFLRIVNSELCPCGHPHHVGRCIASQAKCEDSHRMARFAIRRLRAGDSLSRVILMLDRVFQQSDKPAEIPLDGAPIRGNPQAPVTLVEFASFACPHCARLAPVLERLVKEFEGKVRVAFKHAPLTRHPRAMLAAQAAVAAQNQGKFWEMYDALFRNQRTFDRQKILLIASALGMNLERFTRDLEAASTKARIEADRKLARKLRIPGTPALFVAGRQVLGRLRFENLRDYVDIALDRGPGTVAAAAK